MNDVQKESAAAAESAKHLCETLLSTLTGVGATWASYGLKVGKMALAASAETLGKTAHALDTLAVELDKRAAAKDEVAEAAKPAEPAAPAEPPEAVAN
jgi:MoxR-like ATPase